MTTHSKIRIKQRWHWMTIVALVVMVLVVGLGALNFSVDASAETLLNENDPDYQLSQKLDERYHSDNFLVVVYRPTNQLFDEKGIATLAQLKLDLLRVKGVERVISLLDVPLIGYPAEKRPNPSKIPYLHERGLDLAIARDVVRTSPLYEDLLLSSDGQTTSLQIIFNEQTIVDYHGHHSQFLAELRKVVEFYRSDGTVYLGGMDVIADDLVNFIKRDLSIFGSVVVLCMVAVLSLVFRQRRWIIVAIGCCMISALMMMGILGYTGTKVTVLSSNFISLQIILTMSLVIHLMVKYQELQDEFPDQPQAWLVTQTLRQKMMPSIFAVITTITGFGSLVLSQIVPVMAFGWMMILGLLVSFVMTFVLFLVILLAVDKPKGGGAKLLKLPLPAFAEWLYVLKIPVFMVSVGLLIWGAFGITKLEVENSFINYFKKSTDLHQSLSFIDRNIGGTTPLTIVVNLPEDALAPAADATSAGGEDDFFDDFAEFESTETDDIYWLTTEKVAVAKRIHDYLEAQPESGKVMSIWTTVQVAEQINNGPLGNFELAVLKNIIPDTLKATLWDAFISIPDNEFRFNLRTQDSDPTVRRNLFLKRIRDDFVNELGLNEDQFQLAGAMVLYNNILQSLFDSQIKTLGGLIVALIIILLILLRNIRLALIAILPNVVSVLVVLGFMGWLGLPLDMMTITIASITVGIAIDDAIHYIYRFRKEFEKTGNYMQAMKNTHNSVGQAMVYTTLTIGLGFGILTFSNFIPNVIFGLLTALAMVIALLGSLTLMAVALVVVRPLGGER